jgi:hypothetical protein
MRVDPGAPRGLDALQTLLTTARELVDGLVTDPQLGRIVRAFSMLPECDREPILKVLEKDAAWRRIVEETAGATGITVHPNPHASLYVHVLDQVTGQPRTPEPLLRDGDVIRLGVETFVRLLPLFFEEGVHAQWTAAARDIVRESDVELRGFAVRLAREVLGLVDEAAAEGAVPGPGSETGRLEPHPAARTARGPAK